MSFRKRLKSSMRGAKSNSHRMLSVFRMRQALKRLEAALSISNGLSLIHLMRNTPATTKEQKAAKTIAIAECVIATTKAAYAPFDNITKPI